MGELQIEVKQQSGTISTNFDQVEAELKIILNNYRGIIVTEDTVAASKKDVAALRKIRTSIDDEKKKVKKLWNVPYQEFEDRCKQLMALVDEPINEINKQVNEFEIKSLNEKKNKLQNIYDENIGDYAPFLAFESTLNEKWQNKSFKPDDYLYDLSEKILHIKTDLDACKSLNSEIENEVIDVYRTSGNSLSAAIQRNTQYLSDKAKVEAQVKEQATVENKTAIEIKDEEVPVIEKEEPAVETDSPSNSLVHFVVSAEDSKLVKEFLDFNGILYSIQ